MKKNSVENTQLIEIEKLKKSEKPKKKRRLPLKIFLVLIVLISAYNYFKVETVLVKNNTSYSDKEVIEITGIEPGESMFTQFQTVANIKVMENPMIQSVELDKNYLNREIVINVVEKQFLGVVKDGENSYLIMDDGTTSKIPPDKYYDAPIIYPANLDENAINDLIEQLKLLEPDVIGFISEISYEKTETDIVLELKMTDKNTVYINLHELASKLNYYPELKMSTNGETGVFYLNNGDYFKPY